MLCDLGQRPHPLWAEVAELTALLLCLSLEAPPFYPWLLPSSASPRVPAAPTARQAGGWRKPAGREKAGGAGVTGTGWAWAIAQLGSLARPASTGPHFHQPALPPSSALQTFLANLGCCSPGRGNCRRHSTRPPETLNPFPPSRQSLQAGGWGWAAVPGFPGSECQSRVNP